MNRIAAQPRENRGQAMIGLCLALLFVLLLLGFFAYDMNRMQLAQRQLTAICDAAAMAGSSMLSSQNVSYEDPNENILYNAQQVAVQYAINMFCTGAVLGNRLYDPLAGGAGAVPAGSQPIAVSYSVIQNGAAVAATTSSGATPSNVATNKIQLWIQLTDPAAGFAGFQAGNAQGRAFLIKAGFGYQPVLALIGIGGTVTVPAQSTAATQLMNVILVFDCSGSMDDNTSVTFVERTWDFNPVNGTGTDKYSYAIVPNNGADNRLFNYVGLNYGVAPNGTPLNVLPPQNLTDLGYLYNGTAINPFVGASGYHAWGDSSEAGFYGANPPLAFDMSMRSYVAVPGLWSGGNSYPVSAGGVAGPFVGPWYDNDFGTPPGNCEYKYGIKQTFANPWTSVTCWDGNVNHGWGPGVPAGFTGYYNATPVAQGGKGDGNRYFYDPNAQPIPYTGAAYAPFTDMVVNLVDLNWGSGSATNPCTAQPLTNNGAFGSVNQAFPATSFTVFFAEGGSGNASYLYEPDVQMEGKTFPFLTIDALVEVSRGNMDLDNNNKATNYTNALLGLKATDKQGRTIPAIGSCRVGYQKAYQRLAMYVSQPMATAQAGAFIFFQNLAQTSAAYFGFVGFSASPGNYNGNPDTCAYLSNGGFPTSLFYSCTGNPTSATPTLADYFYHASASGTILNPNVWTWSPMAVTNPGANPPSDGLSGPAGSPTGIPYSANFNPNGPGNPGAANPAKTWVDISFGAQSGKPEAGTNAAPTINWAPTNLGYQIPRCFITSSNSDTAGGQIQSQSFNGVVSNQTMSVWNPNATNAQGWSTTPAGGGANGLWHCRPLTDTGSLEALESALANLGVSVNAAAGVGAYSFTSLTGYGKALSNGRPGAINVCVLFTDGTPTDAPHGDYSNYTAEVINPAQQHGVPIYSIGLALNPNIQAEQYAFLHTLANNGANGSQFFQVTDAASLTAAFTSISKQLTQCLR